MFGFASENNSAFVRVAKTSNVPGNNAKATIVGAQVLTHKKE